MLTNIRSTSAYQNLVDELKGNQVLPGLALMRSARLPVAAALHADLQVPVIYLTDRSDHALTLLDEFGFWARGQTRLIFPEPNPLFYELANWGNATRRDRIQVLTALAVHHIPGQIRPSSPPIIVASARALMARTLPRRDFLKVTRTLKPGLNIKIDTLLRSWTEIGYQPVDIVVEPGQFSHRGGILDIWTPAEILPARLDFFGDEIDTLRRFDPASQRTVESLEVLLIPPAREILPGRAVEAGLSLQDVSEFYLPLVHPATASLLDYLPRQALVLVDDLDILRTTVADVEEQSVKLRQDGIKEGVLPEDFPVPYLTWSELQDTLNGHLCLELGRSTADEPSELARLFTPGQRFGGRLKPFMDFLEGLYNSGERFTIVSRQVSRLKELWTEKRVEPLPDHPAPEFIEGTLGEGWILAPESQTRLHLLTDSEVFGWERPQPRQRAHPSVESPEAAYADLNTGDWVVHVDHGIGRYIGLVRRSLEGLEREFLCVEYEDGDQLFVPIHQADRLTRYIGPDNQQPSPSRLGGVEWSQVKDKVRSAVEEVAKELLELYSKRLVAKGFSFSVDSAWQGELEASFPYVETDDQLRAIEEVKEDMEHDRPMDRLLCGDVGYGKTEVALRAAFKAVMDGKQVAVLVPTTVLAQQHYETFRQRLSPFPVTVEMLSRFRTPANKTKSCSNWYSAR